jgi:hypothetical protein
MVLLFFASDQKSRTIRGSSANAETAQHWHGSPQTETPKYAKMKHEIFEQTAMRQAFPHLR